MGFKTADLCDEFAAEIEVCDPIFRDLGGRNQFAGRIATIKCFEDNSLVRQLVSERGEGRVLVIDAGGSLRRAVLGDLLAQQAADNGWSGVLVYGCIRDSVDIGRMALGVKALATHPMKTDKRGEGQRGIAVRFAGVVFRPDEWLYADEDGVIVAPRALI
ncbi:MAG TPA: ribonuclease E activity regulator RraA [Steroidobacteraceae bacterium]|nr:ribonuclease E activity regulator RraA [Steroidobacteraceae bacterium]